MVWLIIVLLMGLVGISILATILIYLIPSIYKSDKRCDELMKYKINKNK